MTKKIYCSVWDCGVHALRFVASAIIFSVFAWSQVSIPPGQLAAAQAGDANAQYAVGGIYYQHQDYPNSCKWFQMAAARGSMAADSMLQILNGNGHPCAALHGAQLTKARDVRGSDVRVFAANTLHFVRRKFPDAELTYIEVDGAGTISFTLVSSRSRAVVQLNDGSTDVLLSPLRANTVDLPLPHGFIDLSRALALPMRTECATQWTMRR